MKYKNIIFDFGNVLVKFDEKQVLESFCPTLEDFPIMKEAVFHDWISLDGGKTDYDEYMQKAASLIPERLIPSLQKLAKDWYRHLSPLKSTWDFVQELKEKGYSCYILSNAPTFFADHAGYFEITKEFDGSIFSGPIKMLKPEPGIYKYLFDTYQLNPEECLFLDDKEENIRAGKKLGMDGIVFTGDIQKIRAYLEL